MDLPNCKICQSPFDLYDALPIILPVCGHTFCKNCLAKQLKHNKHTIVCPDDSQEYKDILSVAELPKNSLITKMLEKQAQRKCHEHGKPFEFFCVECKVS